MADESPRGTPLDAAFSVTGALETAVRTAYDVIDDYMRRGFEAAGSNQHQSNRRGNVNDYKTNYNWQNPWGPMSMLAEQWLIAMRTWSEAWTSFAPGSGPQQSWNPTGAGSSGTGPVPSVSVQVSSQRPVEVIVNLMPGFEYVDLVADSLHSEGGIAPPIDQGHVSISREPWRVTVRVNLPPSQQAGRYRGLIRNKADACVAGELTLVVGEPRKDSA